MKIMRIRFFAPAGQRPSDPLPTHLKLVTFPTTRLGIGNVGGDGVSAASPLRFVYATIVLLNTNTMIFALGGDSRASCRLDDVLVVPVPLRAPTGTLGPLAYVLSDALDDILRSPKSQSKQVTR